MGMWHALRHESGNNLPVLHTRNCDCGNGCERTPEMHPLSAEHLPRRIQDSTQLAGCAWGETATSGVDESITKAHLVIRRHRISSKGGKFPRKRCDDHRASAQARFDHARAMTAGSSGSAAVQAKHKRKGGPPPSPPKRRQRSWKRAVIARVRHSAALATTCSWSSAVAAI